MPLCALAPRDERRQFNMSSMERHRIAVSMSQIMGVTTAIIALILSNALQDPAFARGLGPRARSHEVSP